MLCKEWLIRQLFSGDLIPTCFQNLTVFDSSESLLKSPIKMNGRKADEALHVPDFHFTFFAVLQHRIYDNYILFHYLSICTL